jgi:hypothetical protein
VPAVWPLPSDEGSHPATPEPGWEESWEFDFAAPDESLGGSVRLAVLADRGRPATAWYWAHIVGRGRDLVAVRDHDVDPPRGRALELRASGLWAELTCETPLDHWSAGLEAMGVALDHPADAFGDERGQPVAVGLDLEWEGVAPCWSPGAGRDGYQQACEVHGEVLVGDQRLTVDARGTRSHRWGMCDWWGEPWWRAHGQLDDGTALLTDGPRAALLPTDGPMVTDDAAIEFAGPEDLPSGATLTIGATRVELMALAPAPVLVPAPGRPSGRLWRAMCRFVVADGRRGTGWCERLLAPRVR